MKAIEELDKLTRAIKDAEFRLKSVETTIDQIDKEIIALEPRKTELEKLLIFHKNSQTIPIAQEYKKAKAELTKIKVRLTLITSDRKKVDDAQRQIVEIIDKFKKDHSELLKNSENNILKPVFGGKRGQK